MGRVFAIACLCTVLVFAGYGSSYPLCTDLRAPLTPKKPLSFCKYNGSVCCNSTQDLDLQNEFKSMNVSSASCASVLKSVLCSVSLYSPASELSRSINYMVSGYSFGHVPFTCRGYLSDLLFRLLRLFGQKCDPFSAELFRIRSAPRVVPVLCNSTVSPDSTQSSLAANEFCSTVWDACRNVPISGSPFAVGKQTNSPTKLSDLWKSKAGFCQEFGGASESDSVCFDGGPVSLNDSATATPVNGMCLEKIGNGSYLNMEPHPDSSNRMFLSNQAGKIWLASVPAEGSGGTLTLDESNPFLDITDEVHFDIELGMLGMAFHPDFQQNGRFFASFNCDKAKWPECSGRCSCNSDVGCDPSKLPSDSGAQPCQYHSIISEFTANGTDSPPSSATTAKPQEVRRIFTMGLPFASHHAGQILFGPEDGYLYFMMGDGGGRGDPYNFAQNKKSLLGKIMRLDVDDIPSASTITRLGLWGNYSIPRDNPYSQDINLQPEIWALGFRNPWRCSFDADRPSYFLCADVGQDQYEEVDIVTKGGNYGWRAYEGPYLYNPPSSPGGNTSATNISPIVPVMGYNHSEVNTAEGSASITGGYFYRSETDPCLYGRYLYSDLYAPAIWAGSETPEGSGNFTTMKLNVTCASDSPLACTKESGSAFPVLGFIFSFGQDNRKDTFVLASSGVYRVARPSRCNYVCSKETNATASGPGSGSGSGASSPSPPSSAEARLITSSARLMLGFCVSLVSLFSTSFVVY